MITLTITENEARMLQKISRWSTAEVYDGIVKTVSPGEFQPFKQTFVDFMSTTQRSTDEILRKIDAAREALK